MSGQHPRVSFVPRDPSPGDRRNILVQPKQKRELGRETLQRSQPAVKRRKTLLACDECRNKKIKCDGARPNCSACAKKGLSQENCIYNDADRKDWTGMKQLVEQLQGRIRSLEDEVAVPTSGLDSELLISPPEPQHNPVILPQIQSSRLPYNDETFLLAPTSAPPISASESTSLTSSGAVDASVDPADAQRDHNTIVDQNGSGSVSAIIGAVTGEPQNQGFHGTSSAVTFMQQIREAIDSRIGVSPESGFDGYQNSHQSFTNEGHRKRSKKRQKAVNYVLPPRRLADSLVQTYWSYVCTLYPFLEKRDFMNIYNRIWSGDWSKTSSTSASDSAVDLQEPTAVCIFYLVLALGCQYSDAIEEGSHRDTAKSFFVRAKECLQFDPIDSSDHSIYLVQAFLLSGQYLQSIGSPHEAWGAIGVATRICHELGFHLASCTTNEKAIRSRKERETTRRVYHGCVMMDRMLSMSFGRPPMVSVSVVDSVPLPSDVDEDWEEDRSNGNAEISGRAPQPSPTLSFFIHSAKLYSIMHKILLSFYPDESNDSSDEFERYFIGPESAFKIDHDLTKWCRSIPDALKMNPSHNPEELRGEESSTLCRLGFILWARFLHVRVYLFRPIFAKFCIYSYNERAAEARDQYASSEIPNHDTITYRMALQCSVLCVKTARELIAVIRKQCTTEYSWGRKPSWLLSVLHVYLAAAVLIAIRLRPDIAWEVTEQEIEDSWAYAIEILRDYQSDSRSSQRCVVALEFLHEKLPNISQEGQQALPQQQQKNWRGDQIDLGAQFQLDQGYQNMDGVVGSWNWEFKQPGWEDFTFLDPFNVI